MRRLLPRPVRNRSLRLEPDAAVLHELRLHADPAHRMRVLRLRVLTMMRRVFGHIADALVGRIVPEVTAGACPCGDCYVGYCGTDRCHYDEAPRYCTNCDCTQTRWVGCVYC